MPVPKCAPDFYRRAAQRLGGLALEGEGAQAWIQESLAFVVGRLAAGRPEEYRVGVLVAARRAQAHGLAIGQQELATALHEALVATAEETCAGDATAAALVLPREIDLTPLPRLNAESRRNDP